MIWGDSVAYTDAPRILRLTIDFYIPRGAQGNVRTHRRMEAVDAITDAVKAVAAEKLPLVTSMNVRHEWMYLWHDKTKSYAIRRDTDPGQVNTI